MRVRRSSTICRGPANSFLNDMWQSCAVWGRLNWNQLDPDQSDASDVTVNAGSKLLGSTFQCSTPPMVIELDVVVVFRGTRKAELVNHPPCLVSPPYRHVAAWTLIPPCDRSSRCPIELASRLGETACRRAGS